MLQHRYFNELIQLENEQIFCGQRLPAILNYLVIGTFEPDKFSGPINNLSAWFYGYESNRLWYLLPMMISGYSLHKTDRNIGVNELVKERQTFCLENKIVVLDLIKTVAARTRLNNKWDTTLNTKMVQSGGNYQIFDFEKAFQNIQFKKVLFMRSSWGPGQGIDIIAMNKINVEKILKRKLIESGKIYNLHTPRYLDPMSNNYKTREEVLYLWMNKLGLDYRSLFPNGFDNTEPQPLNKAS